MRDGHGNPTPRPTGGPAVTRFATRRDQRLSYESSGPHDGLAVLALHDLLADRRQFGLLGEQPTGTAIRLTLPDARGHGASPMISGRAYPAAELVADALAVLDAEGVAQTHVVALGWGALTALGMAAQAPGRVASLVLAAPYAPGLLAAAEETEPRAERARHRDTLQEAATASEKGQTDRALDLVLGVRLGENWREALPKPRLASIRRAASNLAPLLTGMSAEPFPRDALAAFAAPVTILLGEDAPDYERGTAERLASLLPQASIELTRFDRETPVGTGVEWMPAIARALMTRIA